MRLIHEKELMEWSGYKRRDSLMSWLRANHIPFMQGREGRICVTSEAINLPLNTIVQHDVQSSEIDFI